MADLVDVISSIPSKLSRLRLFCELALRYDMAERRDERTQVRDKYIRPILDDYKTDLSHFGEALRHAAPVLYRCHATSAISELLQIPQPERDRALMLTSRYILTRIPTGDAFTSPADGIYTLALLPKTFE